MFPGTQTAITSHFTPQKPPKNGTAPHPTIHNPIHSLWITLRSRPAAGARTKPNGRQEPRRRGRRLEGVRGCVLGLRVVSGVGVWLSGVAGAGCVSAVGCCVLSGVAACSGSGVSGSHVVCGVCVVCVVGSICVVGSVCLVLRSGWCVVFWCSRTPVWLCPRSPRCPPFCLSVRLMVSPWFGVLENMC